MSTTIIILAAGASTRMGRPKQTLVFAGTTLLRHATQTALASRAKSVSVVVGANESVVRAELHDLPVLVLPNLNWKEGMGSTIHVGVDQARVNPEITSVILSVADQPHLTAESFNRIIAAHLASQLPIIASDYSGTVGVPALFGKSVFDLLLALPPDQGCKSLIMAQAETVMRLPCPEAAVDIDSPEDYDTLICSVR